MKLLPKYGPRLFKYYVVEYTVLTGWHGRKVKIMGSWHDDVLGTLYICKADDPELIQVSLPARVLRPIGRMK